MPAHKEDIKKSEEEAQKAIKEILEKLNLPDPIIAFLGRDKELCYTADEIAEGIELEKNARAVGFIGYPLRWSFKPTLENLVKEGKIKPPIWYKGEYYYCVD